jgi:serine/threonine-protein kinase
MARIYVARTTGIGSFERHVVLKMILPERADDESAVQMFLDEARLAASLNHQNVAQVFEVGEDAGIHYLAMEYVHGQDLRAVLARAGSQGTRVPLDLALTVVAGAAAGLHHAHERRTGDGFPMGIVHRDVSPSNLMIGYDGAVKLLDFGIAKATMRSVETQSGIIKGKFAYMAPEQCRGRDVDRRSDVFSLGIILYEVTTQHRCFRADSDFETMHRIVTGDIVRPSRLVQGYPQALEAIVIKALAIDPTQRYQSAGEVLEAIELFAESTRLSLSTMALGRFMRDMFGTVEEPWLTASRNSQPGAARELTISNTNATGGRPLQRQASATLAPPVPGGGSAQPPTSPLVPPSGAVQSGPSVVTASAARSWSAALSEPSESLPSRRSASPSSAPPLAGSPDPRPPSSPALRVPPDPRPPSSPALRVPPESRTQSKRPTMSPPISAGPFDSRPPTRSGAPPRIELRSPQSSDAPSEQAAAPPSAAPREPAPGSAPVAHDEPPMHLPSDALDVANSADPSASQASRADEPTSDASRSASRYSVPSLGATRPARIRVSLPNMTSPPSPYRNPVERATGLAGGSQPIAPLPGIKTGPGPSRAGTRSVPPPTDPAHRYPPTAPTNVTRSEIFAPRYQPPAPPTPRAAVAPVMPLQPAQPARWLYIGLGAALVVIIAVLVMSIINGGEDSPALPESPPAVPVTPTGVQRGTALPPPPAESATAGGTASGGPVRLAAAITSPSIPSPQSDSPEPADQRDDASDDADATITVRVRSTPSSAEVSLAGTPIGSTPLEIHVKRKASFATLVIHRARYLDASAAVDLSADYTTDVKLTPLDDPSGKSGPGSLAKPAPGPRPPARDAKKCQPPERMNPWDTSCGGKPCPACR